MSPNVLSLAIGLLLLAVSALPAEERTKTEIQGEPFSGFFREVTSLAIDRDETLWIGFRYGGIAVYRQGKFFLHNAYNTPIPDEGISAIYVDKADTKWFGTSRGYLYSFDGKEWKVFTVSKELRDSTGCIRSIRSDSRNRIWFITENSGPFRLEKEKIEAIDPDIKFAARGNIDLIRANERREQLRFDALCLDIDRHDGIWIGCRGGLMHFDGHEWTLPGDGRTQRSTIFSLSCNPRTDEVYLATTEGPYILKDGHCRILTDKAPKADDGQDRLGSGTTVIQAGQFVASFVSPHGAIIGKGKDVRRYGVGNETVTAIAFDKKGRIWFGGRIQGLWCLDDGKRKSFSPPPSENPPRPFLPVPAWRKKLLADLVREEPIEVDIHTVLKDPRKYADKKLRIVGSIASSFEYMELVDSDGHKLGIWPEFRKLRDTMQPVFKKKNGRESESERTEFLGFLEWGGYFGHLGGWPMQFTIVETYPPEMDKAEKAKTKKRYLERIEKESYGLPISEYLPETDASKRLQAGLQGAWVLTDIQGKNSPFMFRGGVGTRWIIAGNRLTTGSRSESTRGTLRLDPSHKPAAVDFYLSKYDPYSGEPRMLAGIIALDADKLQVCFSRGYPSVESIGNSRPRLFEPNGDSCAVVFTLRRDREWSPPKADGARKLDSAKKAGPIGNDNQQRDKAKQAR